MSQETISIPTSLVLELIDYSPIYVLVLDPVFNVIAVSSKLLNDVLGERAEKSMIIGNNWLDFVSEEDKNHVNMILISIREKYQINNNFSYNFKSNNGSLLRAHWFNSYINSNHGWIFCIGVPKSYDCPDLREYYMDMIMKDREYIKVAKEVALKYSGKILCQRTN